MSYIVYAIGVYVLAGVTVPYLLCFAGGVVVSHTVDTGALSAPGAWAVDVTLLALFGVLHSGMAHPAVKRLVAGTLSPRVERSTYVLVACLSLVGTVAMWRPLPRVVWELHGPWAVLPWGLYSAGFVGVYVSALWLDHLELLGVKQALGLVTDAEQPVLRIAGPYRVVRHPLMTSLLLAFWATPRMTVGHLIFAVGMAVYVLFGVSVEERRLLVLHGDTYRCYQRTTPMLLPVPPRRDRCSIRTQPSRARETPRALEATRPEIDYSVEYPERWYLGCEFGTALLNAFTILFPEIERFMIRHVRLALRKLDDPALQREARVFLEQEAAHAAQHARSVQILARQGYEVDRPVRMIQCIVAGGIDPLSHFATRWFGDGLVLAIIAGVEHWTATIAEVMLRGDYGARGFGVMKELYYWHAAEELEHKGVVFDLLRARGHGYVVRVVGVGVATVAFVALSALALAALVVQVPRVRQARWEERVRFAFALVDGAVEVLLTREGLLVHGGVALARYLRPGFHPDERDVRALMARGMAALWRGRSKAQ